MKKLFGIGLVATLGLSACGPSGNKANVELMQDMMVQEAIKAQRYDEWFPEGMSALTPPENTQPVGFKPYKYGSDFMKAAAENKNPMAGDMGSEILLTGQKYYNTHCLVCHGQSGKGDGPVAAKYPMPVPPLVSDKVVGWPDGHIYHVITMGQGLMGAYASHIPQKYRWQVVNYIRHLQKQSKE